MGVGAMAQLGLLCSMLGLSEQHELVKYSASERMASRELPYLVMGLLALMLLVMGFALGCCCARWLVHVRRSTASKACQVSAEEDKFEKVYLSQFGERYHLRSDCSGLANRRTSMRSLTRCSICG